MLENIFPKTIFVEKWKKEFGQERAFTKQLSIVTEELFEAQKDFSQEKYDKAIAELVDVMQAASTAMRMIPGYTNQKVDDAIIAVTQKNHDRGYYE